MKTCVEYVWLDADMNYRSKCRVYDDIIDKMMHVLPWNFDGSSTRQSPDASVDTEVYLHPVALYNDPFRGDHHKMVLCETYNGDEPTETNNRMHAKEILDKHKNKYQAWFGMEQEYFVVDDYETYGQYKRSSKLYEGSNYCGCGHDIVVGRYIAEEHLDYCLKAGINICGINGEVARRQWEFQIGPKDGLTVADDLHMARYILERLAEYNEVYISFEPKPFKRENGSGCHTNFSTIQMREGNIKQDRDGMYYIRKAIQQLKNNHQSHMENYGEGNEKRMTGKHETANYKKFSWGIGKRDVSVRVGNAVAEEGYGYFEDRRPASNCDPYVVTSMMYETCCLKPSKSIQNRQESEANVVKYDEYIETEEERIRNQILRDLDCSDIMMEMQNTNNTQPEGTSEDKSKDTHDKNKKHKKCKKRSKNKSKSKSKNT